LTILIFFILKNNSEVLTMQRYHTRSRILTIFLLLCILLFSSCSDTIPAGDLQISYLDVGQGDCSFLLLPDGKTVLIDAGNSENGQEIIQYIRDTGTDTLDYVIATHPHADHIGGMAEVIQAFDVKNVYMPKKSHTSGTFEKLLDTIEAKGLTIETARAGKVLFDTDGLRAEFLAPIDDNHSNLNNASAVLLLTYHNNRFLFMGDAEKEVENKILESGADIFADVLKTGHHGSDTSSTRPFLEAVTPSIGIISVGENNSYGHPDPLTLATLEDMGVKVWRTDEKGTIVVTSDGKNITVRNTDLPPKQNAPPTDTPTEAEKTLPLEDDTTPPIQENPQSVTVYITKSGEKYHRDGCRFLKNSRTPVLLEELDTELYTPCAVCNPPTK
jgi:competence protein ComEC